MLAYEHGVSGIVLSNHGGRQLDTARSAIEILPEVIITLKRNRIPLDKFEVFIDGGIRRGSDIFKAMALGAKCVGIGRPILYGLASYGENGIHRVVDLFEEQLFRTMRLCGTTKLDNINENYVITKNLTDHFVQQANNNLF